MINVAYIALADDGSSYYRIQGIFPFIIDERVNFHDISHENFHSWVTYMTVDVLVFQRPFSQEHINIIEMAHILKIRVISDYDDDVLNIPEHNPAYTMYQQNRKKVQQCIRMSDEVWVSTIAIKKSFNHLNKNIHVIPNAHNDYIYKVSDKKPFNWNNKMVLYRGGHTHYLDLKAVTPMLVKVAKENPAWEFRFMGMMGNEHFIADNAGNDKVSVTNSVPFFQYMQEIQKLNAPIAICPLNVDDLNLAKSNCSWLEMTYAGSAFFANKDLPEFNLLCILPFSLLAAAISEEHVATLKQHNEASWLYIMENLLLSDINKKRLERIFALWRY